MGENFKPVEFNFEPITLSVEKNSGEITPEHAEWLKQLKKRTIICVCSEGLNRSVFAVEYLKKLGLRSKLLPGGLELFQPYLFGDSNIHDARMERRFNRNPDEKKRISEIRTDYNSKYNKILNIDNALWLIFIGGKTELIGQQRTIQHLKKAYGLEIMLLASIQQKSVESNILKLLSGKILPPSLQTR